MVTSTTRFVTCALFVLLVACQPVADQAPPTSAVDTEALIADALSAALPSMAATAKVVDWEGNTLKEGTGTYTCMPTPPQYTDGKSPMCMDHPFMTWADAWSNHTPLSIEHLGISYMLAGDQGASNVDPFATAEAADNHWVVEGPHLMLVVPNGDHLEGISTDPHNGGPYVMWKGTPYAHVMVPLEIPEYTAKPAEALAEALSAANSSMAADAKVVDSEGKVLQEGTGAYTCMPTPPLLTGRAPMCLDEPWMAWADAWNKRSELALSRLGIAYMLAGDEGASNVDPYAGGATADNHWVVEGPHIMVVVPDPAQLEGISTDPHNGGPYVMWKGTPYAHVMVPVAD